MEILLALFNDRHISKQIILVDGKEMMCCERFTRQALDEISMRKGLAVTTMFTDEVLQSVHELEEIVTEIQSGMMRYQGTSIA